MILDLRSSKCVDCMFGMERDLVGDSYSNSRAFLSSTWGQKILELIFSMGQEESKWDSDRIIVSLVYVYVNCLHCGLISCHVEYLTCYRLALVLRYSWTMLKSTEIKLYGFIFWVWRVHDSTIFKTYELWDCDSERIWKVVMTMVRSDGGLLTLGCTHSCLDVMRYASGPWISASVR